MFFGERRKIAVVTSDKLSRTGFKYALALLLVVLLVLKAGLLVSIVEASESHLLGNLTGSFFSLVIPTIGSFKKFSNNSHFPTSGCPSILSKNLFNPSCLLLIKSGVNRPKYSNRFLSGSGGIIRSGNSCFNCSTNHKKS